MVLETKYFVSEFIDNIIQVQYRPSLHLTLEDAEQIVASRLAFYKDLEAPVLIKNARVKSIERAAREYLFDPEKGLKNVKAVAVVHSNIFTRLMVTLIFHRHTPAVPHKMFTDEKKAISWLKQFV